MRLSLLRSAVLGLSLFGASVALADVAPPADGGSTPDMASTMAKPDMSTPVETKDDGCSMAHHNAPANAAALLFGASAVALAVTRRRA